MLRRAENRLAFTLIELMFSMTLSMLVLGSVVGTFITAARSTIVITDQTTRQSQAALGLDLMAEVLRNAVYPVQIVNPAEVRFTDVRYPGVTGRIWLSGNRLMYDTDMGDATAGRALAKPLAGLTITPDSNPLIGDSALTLQISYPYQSFRDFFPDQSRNATFVTSVFMRNTG